MINIRVHIFVCTSAFIELSLIGSTIRQYLTTDATQSWITVNGTVRTDFTHTDKTEFQKRQTNMQVSMHL